MSFDGRDFHAQGVPDSAGAATPDDWYVGQIAIDGGSEPSHLDFMIEDCDCKSNRSSSRRPHPVTHGP